MTTSVERSKTTYLPSTISQFCKKIANTNWFNNFILAIIILAGVLVGIDTNPAFANQYAGILNLLGNLVLWVA